ncbi:MAG: hypothetical protein MUC96_33595, partial [Myxococcaceae bacterium]|nr:hypothetical protein [Myxococcaceae bacterium]
MPIESVRSSRVGGAQQGAGGIPTGTFKVSGDRARITPYAEVIALADGKLRVMGVSRIVDFDAPGATHKESGTRGELEKYTFESSTRMVGGALVSTESTVDPGGWLKRDTRVTNEKMLKVEN